LDHRVIAKMIADNAPENTEMAPIYNAALTSSVGLLSNEAVVETLGSMVKPKTLTDNMELIRYNVSIKGHSQNQNTGLI